MDPSGLPSNWVEKLTERSRRMGTNIDLAELFYTGERNSAADYLAKHGWQVKVRTTAAAYQANGFTLPDDELAAFGRGSGYLVATFE
jgi:O-methyltransferase involved in polyketide biosynthesis